MGKQAICSASRRATALGADGRSQSMRLPSRFHQKPATAPPARGATSQVAVSLVRVMTPLSTIIARHLAGSRRKLGAILVNFSLRRDGAPTRWDLASAGKGIAPADREVGGRPRP